MNKGIRFLLFLSVIFQLQLNFAQTEVTVSADKYPFNGIYEWKNNMVFLTDTDPTGTTKQLRVKFLDEKLSNPKEMSFLTDNGDFYYISGENVRYAYFLDQLTPENWKITIHQFQQSGTYKTEQINLAPELKKLGFDDLSKLELTDIQNTDKALVYQFSYHNTKEKKQTDIAVFITHHNLLKYSVILGDTPDDLIKNGLSEGWQFSGFTLDTICFSNRETEKGKKGWTVANYNSKAILSDTRFIAAPEQKLETTYNTGLGPNGKALLNIKKVGINGNLLFIHNNLFLTGVTMINNQRSVVSYMLNDKTWKQIGSAACSTSKSIQNSGAICTNEGIAFRLDETAYFFPFSPDKQAIIQPFKRWFNDDLSRFISNEKIELFRVSLPTGWLYFNLDQLNKSGEVKFEFVKQ